MNHMKCAEGAALLVMLAILVSAPGAMALSSSFGNGQASTSGTYSIGTDGSFDQVSTLTSSTLNSMGSASDANSIDEYWQWTSGNLKNVAVTYAKANNLASYSYSKSGTVTQTKATAKESVKATNDVSSGTSSLLLGGFAYNKADSTEPDEDTYYAGVVTAGTLGSGATISYKNSLYATSSKVSAAQSYSAGAGSTLESWAWAELGGAADEALTSDDIDAAWEAGDLSIFYAGMSDAKLLSYQKAYFSGAKVSSYSSSATMKSGSLSSKQSASIRQEGDSGWRGESGYSWFDSYGGYSNADSDKSFSALASAYAIDGKTSYSSSSTAASSKATATQTLSASNAKYAQKYATASSISGLDSRHASSIVLTASNNGILASLSGTDTATATSTSAAVTQKMGASGGSIYRESEAMAYVDSLYSSVKSYTEIFYDAYSWSTVDLPASASTLSGTVTAKASGSASALSGSYKVKLAKDISEDYGITFYRYTDATNTAYQTTSASAEKTSFSKAQSFSYKETASAKGSVATAT